jgi:uncharacterized protein (DUF2141 family)
MDINNKMAHRISIIILAGVFFFTGCANQVAPSGGEVDKTPPVVVVCSPDSNTVNFTGNSVSFTFNKYMDKRSFKDALFISPAVDESPEISWTGKSVEVTFKKGFKAGRTYNITIGTDAIDYYAHNRMAKAYTLTFSTGPKIDRGVIEGTVFDEKPSGVMAYAYFASDSLEITKDKPEYVSQVGEKGDFRFAGLSPNLYRVFVIRDEFRDFLFHPEKNFIGVPSRDVQISEKDSLGKGLQYMLSRIDTVKPRLINAVMTDKYHVLVSFTEEVDASRLNAANFVIIDSTVHKNYSPVYSFRGKAKIEESVLSVKSPLPDSDKIYVQVQNFYDRARNKTDLDFTGLLTNQKPDTTAPQLIKTDPQNKAIDVPLDSANIVFGFDDGFAVDSMTTAVTLADTMRNLVPAMIHKIDDASFSVHPLKRLKSNTPYIIRIPFKKVVDLAGNSLDSLYEYHFTSVNDLDNTGIKGTLSGYQEDKNPVLVLTNVENPLVFYKTKPGKNGVFSYEKIKPGKYKLLCFYDLNNNGICDKGFPKPFIPAEPFLYLKEPIGAPARWAVTDVLFDVSELK